GAHHRARRSFPTRRSSDLSGAGGARRLSRRGAAPDKARDFEKQGQEKQSERHHEDRNLRIGLAGKVGGLGRADAGKKYASGDYRSEEHTSELQSRENLVCR